MKTWIPLVLAGLLPAAAMAQAQHDHHDEPDEEADAPAPARPVHDHAAMGHGAKASAERLPHGREGSGTSWMPDSTPVYAHHFTAGDWMLMLHYSAALGYDDQWSDRGSRRLLSTNWMMGMASHSFLGGELEFRGMLTAEPATAGGSLQVPLLLQSGETYGGVPLHDRQHPHDFLMELAVLYRHSIAGGVGFELYAAPSGEPALGPTAFMHRLSAMANPFPPISHHWQDSTHISFPVLTAGLYNQWVKLEGSLFHGREPDEDRWNLDLGPLDSWSVRLSANPTAETSFQVSYGYIHSPEALNPDESQHRLTASAAWSHPLSGGGNLALIGIWGRNLTHESTTDSFVAEAQLDVDGKNVPFLRLEHVEKLGHDLVVPGDPEARYGVAQAVIGYQRRLPQLGPLVPTIGGAMNIGVVPDALQQSYGTRVPVGAFVFLGVQPPAMHAGHH